MTIFWTRKMLGSNWTMCVLEYLNFLTENSVFALRSQKVSEMNGDTVFIHVIERLCKSGRSVRDLLILRA
uniref:Uncharacterized protein n=1 Tax=Panagrolaimus sp. JU765 TaxID=591449 RepID=A0AC34QEM2_9BILA